MPATISVCMATYNGSRYVADQIASVLDQLGEHDELVIVDDASTDDTVEALKRIVDPRIRLVENDDNVGYVRAFERALSLSRGDHVFLSDQDDVWPPGRVATMQRLLATHMVVAGNIAQLGGPDRIPGPFGEKDWRLTSTSSEHTARNLARLAAQDMPYFGSAMAVRRDLLNLALPFPPSVRELHDAWLALLGIATRSIAHLDERVVLRRIHDANTSGIMRSPHLVLRGRWFFLRMTHDAWRRARDTHSRRSGLGSAPR
jgi:glycosyltransferase involved in cell wall biosynthesis